MTSSFFPVVTATVLLASSTPVHASCNPALTDQFAGTERVVDSLRPDNPYKCVYWPPTARGTAPVKCSG